MSNPGISGFITFIVRVESMLIFNLHIPFRSKLGQNGSSVILKPGGKGKTFIMCRVSGRVLKNRCINS